MPLTNIYFYKKKTPYQYWGLEKQNYLQKHIHIFSHTLKTIFQIVKIKNLIQVLASASENHTYIILTFETNANNIEWKMYPKKLILFSQIHILVPFIRKPLVCTQWNHFWGYFIMLSPICNIPHQKMEIFSCTLLCALQNTRYNMKVQWPPILMIPGVWFIIILLHHASILSHILYFSQI
jgi:hypothetical protein